MSVTLQGNHDKHNNSDGHNESNNSSNNYSYTKNWRETCREAIPDTGKQVSALLMCYIISVLLEELKDKLFITF